MRNIRFYETDAAFKAYEQGAGGTGNDVEAMVPGIVKTADLKKMYFNPHDKTIQFHTLTIYYEKSKGEQLSECKTMRIKYISGVTQEIVVTPKNIDGYIAKEEKIVANIPADTSIVFRYKLKLDYSKPLTFNIISGGTIVWKANTSAYTRTIEYSTDSGKAWTSITATTGGTPFSVNAGDTIQFRGNNATYSFTSSYNSFDSSTAIFEVEGNIMSLINSENFATATTLTSNYTFSRLFYYCTGLISAENLILPATALAKDCYNRMFYGCTSLAKAPALPATTLAERCYSHMFYGCTSLTSAPALPATTLADSCYYGMFYNCTSLETAPALPATTLTYGCYEGMFRGCTSLTTAPELPATTLARYCYISMFSGCTNLNYIKCLATDISAKSCTTDWVNGVASTGTFVTPSSTNWNTGLSGIPSGWTRQNAS